MRRLGPWPILALVVLALATTACGGERRGGDATPVAVADPGVAITAPSEPDEPAGAVDLTDTDFADRTGETEVEVLVRDNSFTPAYVEVSVGTKVVFPNRGRVEHNVLPVVSGAFPAIEREDLRPGDVGTVTFDQPGDFPYYCSLHGTTTRGMVGAVRVVEG